MSTNNQALREENEVLRKRIDEFQQQRLNSGSIDNEIKKFIDESDKNITDMKAKVAHENSQMNERLQEVTVQYESTLKQQIALLTKNKELNKKKEEQDQVFNEKVEKITSNYEVKIKDFELKVKANVKKIKQMSETNVIKKLLQSERFRTEMKERGVKIDVLEKQSELEEVIAAVEEKEVEIAELEAKSSGLDEELTKMRELIETMKELLENMVKEKENIVKQNAILKEKLRQSEELIGKLLGSAENEEQDEDYEEDFENEGEEGQEDETE